MESTVDGRTARGQRTRQAIAESLIALLEEGDPQPTARRVAERAGVSLRLVFHHFEDMEQVLHAAVAVQIERHWSRLRPIDPNMAHDERIALLVRQLGTLYDIVAPVRRAAELAEASSPTLHHEMAAGQQQLRRWLATVFPHEIAAGGEDGERLLDLIEVSTSFDVWDLLRRRMGRSHKSASASMTDLLTATLALHFVIPLDPRIGGTK
ncbi:MAG: TetR/AcrR family transcriptional regulator [Acidimicrobiales bacterium]